MSVDDQSHASMAFEVEVSCMILDDNGWNPNFNPKGHTSVTLTAAVNAAPDRASFPKHPANIR